MSQFGYGNYGGGGGGFSWRLIIGVVIALLGVVSYFMHTSVNPTTGEKQHVSMSAGQEVALGMQSAPEMAQQMGGEAPPSDPEAQEVAMVGQRVATNSKANDSPYRGHFAYHLLNDTQTINAFALPGGQIFITKGLYDKLSDEAELAGVLGHETGHVVERHSAQQMEKQKLGQSLVLGTAVATSDRRNGAGAAAAAAAVNQLINLKYSREDESQADQRGLEFMTQAGYSPTGMRDVMKILQSVSGSGNAPDFLQTHPNPGNRLEAINDWIKGHPDAARVANRGGPLPKD